MTDDQILDLAEKHLTPDFGDVLQFARLIEQEAARQERERYEELLKAAKFVAFSNGFDAAYPDKLDALRALVRRSRSSTTGEK